jgi:4,5-dihydroxyphthalate decarboxylase
MRQTRRDVLKAGAMSTACLLFGRTIFADTGTMRLRMAGYPFEHVKGLIDGAVPIEGCSIAFEPGKIGDLNTHVFSGPQKLDVTEIGLTPFNLAWANDDFRDYSLLPIFPLRTFRHKSIFINSDSGIEHPGDLKGRRVGTPGYSSTSLTWIRGILSDEYGVKPKDIQWVVSSLDSSANNSGSTSRYEQNSPDGISIETGPAGKDESQLLVDGDVDALFHAAEPRAFVEGHPKVRRLFTDSRKTEHEYFAKTGIFPIMHAVAIRNELAEEHPWLAEAVFRAYSTSKRRSYESMEQKWFLRTLPWFAQELDSTREVMGENFWPYGIESNRKTLDALFRYAHDQGLARRRVSVEEMFHPAARKLVEA